MYWLLRIGFFLLINKSMACTIPKFSSLTVQANFSLNHFLGIWYEIEWFSSEYHNESNIWRDFTLKFEFDNNSSQRLLVPGRARLFPDENCFSFGPWLIIANNSAKMILEKKNLNSSTDLNWPYYILKTDYDHYALIYACVSTNYTLDDQCIEPLLWVFSRTIFLSDEYLNELDDYIENTLCINLTKLETTPHSEKSCYALSSSGSKLYSMSIILYLFLIYK
jgi:lipocalin